MFYFEDRLYFSVVALIISIVSRVEHSVWHHLNPLCFNPVTACKEAAEKPALLESLDTASPSVQHPECDKDSQIH